MSRSGSCVAVAAAFALLVQPAGAQTGNGLYEPFPRTESREQGKRFVERLPRAPNEVGEPLRGEDLERGRFIAGGNDAHGEPPPGLASGRAGRDSASGSLAWPVQIALALALLAAGSLALVGRDRRRVVLGLALAGSVVLATAAVVSAAGGDGKAGPPAENPRPLPHDFIGVVAPDVLAAGRPTRKRVVREQKAAGVGVVRQTFDWSEIEVAPGRYDFARYDEYVADLAAEGMRILPILFNAPAFRTTTPSGTNGPFYPPRRLSDMGGFAAALVTRYGPGGRFWSERRDVPRLPIRTWQVWNEPNLGFYWGKQPNPAAYTRMLAAARRAIERVDPRAEVVSAGITEGRLGVPAPEFLAAMDRAGGRTAYDTLAVQAYARDATALVGAVADIRALLRRRGDRRPIRLTEFGWATGGPLSDFTVGEAAQARLVGSALKALSEQRRALGLRGLAYFRWRDAPPYRPGQDFFGLHTGLVRTDGRPKPALAAFGSAARSASDGP